MENDYDYSVVFTNLIWRFDPVQSLKDVLEQFQIANFKLRKKGKSSQTMWVARDRICSFLNKGVEELSKMPETDIRALLEKRVSERPNDLIRFYDIPNSIEVPSFIVRLWIGSRKNNSLFTDTDVKEVAKRDGNLIKHFHTATALNSTAINKNNQYNVPILYCPPCDLVDCKVEIKDIDKRSLEQYSDSFYDGYGGTSLDGLENGSSDQQQYFYDRHSLENINWIA